MDSRVVSRGPSVPLARTSVTDGPPSPPALGSAVARVSELEEQLEAARQEVVSAREQSRHAHRDAARLVRVLTAISRPARDTAALQRTALETISEAFGAEVVCLVHGGAPEVFDSAAHVVVASCGFPHGDTPLLPDLPTPLVVAWAGDDSPGSCASWSGEPGELLVAGVTVRTAARLVLDPRDAAAGALLVLRTDPACFTATELKLLQSVTERLYAALQATERRNAAELLASAADIFTRRADSVQLLDEACRLVADLTNAEWTGVVEVCGDEAMLRAQGGSLGLDLSQQWPRQTHRLLEWPALHAGSSVLCHDLATVPEHPDCPPRSGVRTVLSVPVMTEGAAQVLLYALHGTPSAFSRTAVEAVEQLSGSLSGALVAARLHAALLVSEQELRHRATHDALTGLANRALFRVDLEAALGDSDMCRTSVGVLFCDLDDFKIVNDRLGHDAGDELLVQVARRLSAAVPPGDLLARLGGDEFVVLLTDVPGEDEVQRVGERLLMQLTAPFELVSHRGGAELVCVGGSIGAAVSARGGNIEHLATELLRNADAAMYEAKRGGGRCARTYDAAAAARSRVFAELAHDVVSAVERGQVHLLYQPVWDFAADAPVGVEALVRWTHPVHGPVPPDVFIPKAERNGAVVELGRWVRRTALAQVAGWDATSVIRLSVSVNASPVELAEPDFTERVLEDLAETGVPARRLCVEVTEGLPLGGQELVRIAELRQAGIRVLIDDFGVSHSDLARLKHLRADGLKVDKSLVNGLSTALDADPMDRGVVDAILTLARTTGMAVVAEGVETADQRDALVALGCRTAQGYLMGRPMTSEAVSEVLRDRARVGTRHDQVTDPFRTLSCPPQQRAASSTDSEAEGPVAWPSLFAEPHA